MPERLLARVESCYQLAEAFFKQPFARPEVSLKLRGQKAGVAHLQQNLLRFNAQLYEQNREHFLHQTVAHEVAHLVAHQLFGPHIRPHGEEWQLIMRGVYELPPDRCHTYEVPRRRGTRYLYRCDCAEQEFAFTAQRHALVAKGRRYICRRCRATLTFSGRQREE
ncbi:SprT family zinc-dependent metalloprotease [Stutzerimonas nosocomialis]|uniref:SprT family zinc-dependent metalloprotease n=1 Tax=Stutzerimonas nosocomialis TaxID=1056496 RepID=A0A5R9Q9B7_9GAMM|nr:SprT family zinc-dependent metalloprotease [Stutzerimonas nosocomialis]TLX59592.1 SprT family zinc-dependent metalloprotease [Stutzerimonas nosocomialis]TLX60408.1 SprT family zinc-dependent metalloprotease [Stutzerimonas nosocomialis]TLX61402.1 SprT family zinc-dependent metalloprotease [Stutzerimonas nosocomialis]